MKKLILLLLIPILLCGCAKVDDTPESSTKSGIYLEVSSQIWSGWDPNAEFEVITEQHEIVEGYEFEVEGLFRPLCVTVKTVSEQEICLTFNDALSVANEDGGYNMLETQTEITVPFGETVKLATPSFDAGCIYKLTYVANAGE